MRAKVLTISLQDMVEVLAGKMRIRNLPADAKILSAAVDGFQYRAMLFQVESQEFTEVEEGFLLEPFFAQCELMLPPEVRKEPLVQRLLADQCELVQEPGAQPPYDGPVAVAVEDIKCGQAIAIDPATGHARRYSFGADGPVQ